MPPFLEIIQNMYLVLRDYWWLFAPAFLLIIFETVWMNYIMAKAAREMKWLLLEIKVQAGIEKGPQIFEHILTGLYAVRGGAIDTDFDIYLKGVVESYFSLELAGIDGRFYFFMYVPEKMKDLAEAQIYAQYPQAEIKEAEDYAKVGPTDFPDKNWDIWGAEMILDKEDAYPVRTYNQFQEKITSELIDPIAAFIEEFGKHNPGEQTWFQVLIRPVDDYWKKDAAEIVAKLIGKKIKKKTTFFTGAKKDLSDIILNLRFAPFEALEYKKEELPNLPESLMLFLSPGEKEVVEAIEKNVAKVGFETMIRWFYIGRKKVFNKAKGFFSVMGPLHQFTSQNLNMFAVDGRTKTSAYYVITEMRKNIRKRLLVNRYRRRDFYQRGFVLNLEELATLYHFPTIGVEAPQTPRVQARKSESPRELPIG
ncbi:hypothetical protein KJ695_02765 [Patescibacteria group bacterium]|nr:hypothetical protein [Patescibacteria group bacterium]MBU4368244.1 hypothetical protein [Patescibacteria group bacterium]